eukprot:8214544-Alexandrium_andersonii.AAC.1
MGASTTLPAPSPVLALLGSWEKGAASMPLAGPGLAVLGGEWGRCPVDPLVWRGDVGRAMERACGGDSRTRNGHLGGVG